MRVYSYYYGARAENGIGIQAQSRQLEELSIRSDLNELASMHALESEERDNEMLSYFLQRDGYRILGLSYIEAPKSSGYNRSAPCSLQYIAAENDMQSVGGRLSEIVNFINFQKPASLSPAPMASFPLNESGYYYHNSRAVLAPLVDGLVRAALSTRQEVMLIALPKGKNSTYATARYTMAEALSYLPVPLRLNIRFFTGLPVGEGVSDHRIGYDNAVKFGANVIFCPNEYYGRLKNYYSFIGLDMDHPNGQVGQFASYVTQTTDPSAALLQISRLLNGTVTYDGLNQAAARAMQGETVTIDSLKLALDRSEKRCRELERDADRQHREFQNLQNAYDDLAQKSKNPSRYVQETPSSERDSGVLSRILLGALVIVLMALAGFAGWLLSTHAHTGSFFPPREEQPRATATPAAAWIAATEAGAMPTGIPSTDAPKTDAPITDVPKTNVPATQKPTATASVTPAPSVSPSPTPGRTTAAKNVTVSPAPGNSRIINRYGKTNTVVNMRTGADIHQDIINELRKDTYVWMVRTLKNDEDEEWTEVYVNGKHGYIMSKYLTPLSEDESNDYKNNGKYTPVPPECYGK